MGKKHFEGVLNHMEPPNSPEEEPGNYLNMTSGSITRAKALQEYYKSINGKAAGRDNIPPEAIKARGRKMSEEVLLGFLNRIWKDEVQEEWKKGLLINLPKKGDLIMSQR